MNSTVVTGIDGSWTVNDTEMLLHQNFTFLISFLDVFKQPENESFNATISTVNQNVILNVLLILNIKVK